MAESRAWVGIGLIGCAGLLADLRILGTRAGGDGSGPGHVVTVRRLKDYGYAFVVDLRLRQWRPASVGPGASSSAKRARSPGAQRPLNDGQQARAPALPALPGRPH